MMAELDMIQNIIPSTFLGVSKRQASKSRQTESHRVVSIGSKQTVYNQRCGRLWLDLV